MKLSKPTTQMALPCNAIHIHSVLLNHQGNKILIITSKKEKANSTFDHRDENKAMKPSSSWLIDIATNKIQKITITKDKKYYFYKTINACFSDDDRFIIFSNYEKAICQYYDTQTRASFIKTNSCILTANGTGQIIEKQQKICQPTYHIQEIITPETTKIIDAFNELTTNSQQKLKIYTQMDSNPSKQTIRTIINDIIGRKTIHRPLWTPYALSTFSFAIALLVVNFILKK